MNVGPEKALPLSESFSDVDEYVDSLLRFGSSSWLLQTLCGGVHILDFFTRSPDIYAQILAPEWRDWFEGQDIMVILDLLMREENLEQFSDSQLEKFGGSRPPESLIQYITDIRRHSLGRSFTPLQAPTTTTMKGHRQGIPFHIAVGMKDKKVHEVDNFARYVTRLTSRIAATKSRNITHLVDFGSGQNYLGRALASEPYNKHMIAVESKAHNIEGSKIKDVTAKLVKKEVVMRNKKQYRTELYGHNARRGHYKKDEEPKPLPVGMAVPGLPKHGVSNANNVIKDERTFKEIGDSSTPTLGAQETARAKLDIGHDGKGSVQYVTHRIENGDLSPVIDQIVDPIRLPQSIEESHSIPVSQSVLEKSKAEVPNLMTISLHSCGNLLHHGLRTLTMNSAVSAICLVGCCYNLVTERLGPATYKLPSLRPNHPRLIATSSACDPHGFPMSERLASYEMPALSVPSYIIDDPTMTEGIEDMARNDRGTGINLNITARMMAVQAPQNWGPHDSDAFFTRHFYRALLQRIFLDLNLVPSPTPTAYTMCFSADTPVRERASQNRPPKSPAGTGSGGDPIIIGTLKKSAYASFLTYVRAAGEKLGSAVTSYDHHSAPNPKISSAIAALSDDAIKDYEQQYLHRKKHLSVVWALMAYSASVVESVIVVDRWLWLKEQDVVSEAWVEPVFDYKQSPRNLCLVAIKK